MKVDGENHPVMSRICAMAIVKALMPKVDTLMKASGLTTLKNCTEWLGELAGGTTWVNKMRAIEEANELQLVKTAVILNAQI